MPCQLMVGFFAYAKSFEIRVDKKELEGTYSHLEKNEFDNWNLIIVWVELSCHLAYLMHASSSLVYDIDHCLPSFFKNVLFYDSFQVT